jgi:class 3 adenylate cyclase
MPVNASGRFFSVFLIFSFAFLAVPLTAQNTDRLNQLQAEVDAATGAVKAQKLIVLSDACLQAGRYEQAAEWAEEAEALAKALRQPELRALALNQEGKALMRQDKRGWFGKSKAGPKFSQSITVLRNNSIPNEALLLDNLEQLRELAVRGGNREAMLEAEARIAETTGGTPGARHQVAVHPPVPSQGRRYQTAEAPAVASSPPLLPMDPATMTAEETRQMQESQQLQELLARKQEEINRMTEEQMKTAMLVMEQRALLDSIGYHAQVDSLQRAALDLQVREAQASRSIYVIALIALLLLSALASVSFLRARQQARILEEKNKIIREEQQRSENLLLNILPGLVAEELKRQGRTQARLFKDVSVLFADFVNFSSIAEKLGPEQLVGELDTCFQAFDEIVARHGLEKIKTIGDAYMCAGGMVQSTRGDDSHLRDMIEAARDMQAWLCEWNARRDELGLPRFDARIGIHRGPVVAGVVGSKKFAFDIWGDTVNIAARIEQASEGGKINISGEAYEVIKEYFPCAYRGKIKAKNKGEIDMYFVEN